MGWDSMAGVGLDWIGLDQIRLDCEILKHIGYTISMSVEMHIDVNQHLGTSPLYHSLRRSRKHGSVTTWVPALRHTGGSGAAKRSAAFRYVEDLEGSAVELQRRS